MKYVSQMLKTEIDTLKELYKKGPNHRIRERAHILLLNHDSFSISKLCEIFNRSRYSISTTIDRWENLGLGGLYDKEKSGRPPLNRKRLEKFITKEIKNDGRSLKNLLSKISENLGFSISRPTLKRIVKSLGYRWKRIRKSLKGKRNEEAFRQAQFEIEDLINCAKENKIDLYYFDESYFSLTPEVPYAWQPNKEYSYLTTSKSKSISVMGFLSIKNKFESFIMNSNINAEVVIQGIQLFLRKIKKNTVVILDNSPVHRSKKFMAKIPEWEKEGLILKFIPPYSPELNKIEILWKFIKYYWLPVNSFKNLKNLRRNLFKIFRNIGTEKYSITFG